MLEAWVAGHAETFLRNLVEMHCGTHTYIRLRYTPLSSFMKTAKHFGSLSF